MSEEKEKKQLNRATQEKADRDAGQFGDEEFAEKIYDDDAPVPQVFQEQHEISITGVELEEPLP